jgi:drug/metabolite transporter (DMT)-like permease
MGWFAFIIISVITSTAANLYRRAVMKHDTNDVIASVALFQILGAIIIGIVAFIHGFVFPPITTYPINFLLSASLWGTATFMLFKASQTLEASVTTIIVTLSSFVTIISAIFFLHVPFGPTDLIGTILIIASVVIVSMKTKTLVLNKGVFYALGFCLLAGLAYTNDTYLVHHTNALSYLTVSSFNAGLFLLLIRPKTILKMKPIFTERKFMRFFIFALFSSVAAMTLIWAINIGGNIAQIAPIAQSGIILTVISGDIFLKENDNMGRKIIAAILVTIGVLLLR